MSCVGCPIACFHTVDDACREHGTDRARFLADLRGAIEGVDIKAVMQASRRIKEESDAIGAFPLSKVAGRIENAATANDWSAIGRGMEEFRREQARLNSSIEVLS